MHDTAKEKPPRGTVVAVGAGKVAEDGQPLPLKKATKCGSTARSVGSSGKGGFFKEIMGPVASGTPWRYGGIGVAEWTGGPLGAVLDLARVRRDTPRDIPDVLVEGLDSVKVNRPRPRQPRRAARAQHPTGLDPVGLRVGRGPGNRVIVTRAIDDQGNTQPAAISWNAQGYGYNVPVPHPVKVT